MIAIRLQKSNHLVKFSIIINLKTYLNDSINSACIENEHNNLQIINLYKIKKNNNKT